MQNPASNIIKRFASLGRRTPPTSPRRQGSPPPLPPPKDDDVRALSSPQTDESEPAAAAPPPAASSESPTLSVPADVVEPGAANDGSPESADAPPVVEKSGSSIKLADPPAQGRTKGMYSGNAPPPTAAKYRFDFRSDTVTTPTAPMLEQMMAANVGDDVFQEDPTINKLQRYACELTGHEAALFCASATMSNQLAIRSLLGAPPHSVVCDKRAHVFQYEASGIAYHTGASVFAVDPKTGSSHLTLDVVEKACVLDDDVHHAPTKLVCLENTLHGEIFPIDEIRRISEFARKNGLKMHLDGARLWNASVATGISLREYCKEFDSVSLCLSKGLGAPVGSLLVGSHDLIKKARHFRKMFGGGWRQAGLLASAGLFAIEHHWTLLKQDHENAQILADSLVKLGFKLVHRRDTNMVFVDSTPLNLPIDELRDELAANGIRIFGGGVGVMRLVLHHQISREAVSEFIKITETVMSKRKGKKGWF